MALLALVLMVLSLRKKAYPYFISGSLCFAYSVLYRCKHMPPPWLLNSILWEFVDFFELVLPFVLLVCVFYISRNKNQHHRRNYLPAVISVIICVTRLAKAIFLRIYLQKIIDAGSQAIELVDDSILYTNINSIVVLILYSALILTLLWHMKRYDSIMRAEEMPHG